MDRDPLPASIQTLVDETIATTQHSKTAVVFAPGRVNLIGEHTDYTGGNVLPMTLPFGTCVVVSPRDDRALHLHALTLGETFVGPTMADANAIAAAPLFARYALGAFAGSAGANVTVKSSLPLGAGLSSSASYLCSLLLARSAIDESRKSDPWTIAREAQRIENDVIGLSSGILDPAAVCLSTNASALLLDCTSLETTPVAIPSSVAVLVADSGAPRTLATSAYNARFETCQKATALLGVESLSVLRPSDLPALLSKLGVTEQMRVRHVVTENARVLAFASAMATDDVATAGALLSQSHASLRDDYEVSSSALDSLAQTMESTPGVVGARMCGAGFGGCCVALVTAADASAAAKSIDATWEKESGQSARTIVAEPAGAARKLPLD